MLSTFIRLLKGEQIFMQTKLPNRYSVGSVVATRIGGGEKAVIRITAVTPSQGGLYSVWGTVLRDEDKNNVTTAV